MQKKLNLKIKFRESFRPFAPSVLREDLNEWFELDGDSPYMLLVSEVKKDKQIKMKKEDENLFGIDKLNIKRSSIPAITHVDYSARIQTVHKETNSRYYDLIDATGKYSNTNVFGADGVIYKEETENLDTFSFSTQTDIEGIIINQLEK